MKDKAMPCNAEDMCNCTGACLNCPDYDPIMEEDNGARGGAWIMLAILAFLALAASCRADEMDVVSDAAWYAYHDKQALLPANKHPRDCDNHARKVYRYLQKRGVPAKVDFCERGGELHMFLTYHGWAIDNTSPNLIRPEQVGCDN